MAGYGAAWGTGFRTSSISRLCVASLSIILGGDFFSEHRLTRKDPRQVSQIRTGQDASSRRSPSLLLYSNARVVKRIERICNIYEGVGFGDLEILSFQSCVRDHLSFLLKKL